MSITTVNKHISRLGSLMKHCIKEGYLSANPASGLKVKQKRRPDEERKAYTADDLKKIVANLPPKEIKPERYCFTPGGNQTTSPGRISSIGRVNDVPSSHS